MTEPPPHGTRHPALARIIERADRAGIDAALGESLPLSDVATLLLDVFTRRAASVTGADVMRQYGQDRFVAPTPVDALALARVELTALEAAAPAFEPVVLAPLVPLGTHGVMGATPQNNVVSTARMTEVTADPTNSLALEAASRRRKLLDSDSRSSEAVNLAATTRVTRAQPFEGPNSFPHFSLFGMVTAGRDVGNFGFETDALRRQLGVLIDVLRRLTAAPIELRLTAFTARAEAAVDELVAEFGSTQVRCSLDPDRSHGRGYYRNVCFKLMIELADGIGEVGDGGDVWWTQELVQNKKERLIISGLGLERVALFTST